MPQSDKEIPIVGTYSKSESPHAKTSCEFQTAEQKGAGASSNSDSSKSLASLGSIGATLEDDKRGDGGRSPNAIATA